MFDLIVVGAGPSGIAAAAEAQRGGLTKVLVLEKGASHSQMIRTYYKIGKRVDAQYAGQQAICMGLLCLKDGDRESYMDLMDHVIDHNAIDIQYNTEVWAIHRRGNSLMVQTKGDQSIEARCVLVAIGRMGRPNQPDYYKEIPQTLKNNKSILFDITSRTLSDQDILVVGGGDTAAEYCDILSRDSRVTFSYRQTELLKMNGLNQQITRALIADGRIDACLGSNIASIRDDGGRPVVTFREAEFGERHFDIVVYALGGMSPVDFLRSSGVTLNERGEALTSDNNETVVQGLYVAGDLLGKGSGGGSIIAGFNSATAAVRNMLTRYFDKTIEAEVVDLDHLRF